MCGVRWCPTVLPAGGSPPFSGANAVRHQRTSRRRIPSLFGSHNIGNGLEFGEFAVEVEVLLHYDVYGHQSVQRQIGPVVQEISYDSLDGEEALQSGSLAQQGFNASVAYSPDVV